MFSRPGSNMTVLAICLLVASAVAPGAQNHDPGACQQVGDTWVGDTWVGDTWAERALNRSLSQHLGLPDVPHPTDNPPSVKKIELGRKLFFDRRLSINGTMSCAMCHVPEQGFANRELQTSVGVEGRSVKRNAPTVINVGFLDVLFHDGRDLSLETQFIMPLISRNEMANPSAGRVVGFLRSAPEYQLAFDAAFGAQASLDRIGMALGAYQRSLSVGDSDFDRWYYAGDAHALNETQQRGLALFQGKGGCASCHLMKQEFALFTDQQFHDTGYGWMREQSRQNPPPTTRVQLSQGVFVDVDSEIIASVSAPRQSDIGRYEVTEDPEDRWKFRTPPLRNVALTPPYMHDGGLASLADVIRFYNDGGPDHPLKDPRIRALDLSDTEQKELEAFLNSLTSSGLDCLVAEARSHPPDNY